MDSYSLFNSIFKIALKSTTTSCTDTITTNERPVTAESAPPCLYTLDQVSQHCDSQSCWVVLNDRVYDVTDFIRNHPGGEDVILENAGRDISNVFKEAGHPASSWKALEPYYIGQLVEKERMDYIAE